MVLALPGWLQAVPHGFPNQLTEDCYWRPGRAFECSGDFNSMAINGRSSPISDQGGHGDNWVVGNGFSEVLGTSTGAVSGSGTRAALVVVMSGHKQATGGEACHAFACGLSETSGATPHSLWCEITGGMGQVTEPICRRDYKRPRHQDARDYFFRNNS